MSRHPPPALAVGLVDLPADPRHVVAEPPAGVVAGELADVADPPDVVARPVRLRVRPRQLPPGDPLADVDRLQHRAVAEPPAADVVDLARPRRLEELVEGGDQVRRVDV